MTANTAVASSRAAAGKAGGSRLSGSGPQYPHVKMGVELARAILSDTLKMWEFYFDDKQR